VERWGPATQQALKAAGYEPKPGETLGLMLARYNEDPTATRPEDVGGSSVGGSNTAVAAAAPNTGLLAQLDTTKLDQLRAQQAAAQAAAAEAAKSREQDAEYAALQKQGMGLLQQNTGQSAQPPQFLPPPQMAQTMPQQEDGMPDFRMRLAQQRLARRV